MERVAPGSVIITDGWAAYEGLDQIEGHNYKVTFIFKLNPSLHALLQHFVINHSQNFLNPLDRNIHTQRIESTVSTFYNFSIWNLSFYDQCAWPHHLHFYFQLQWHTIKRTLPGSGRYEISSYLPCFLWFQQCKRLNLDPTLELLRLIGY